jgi:Cu(I)/Ag(I) efflux system membrane protein CusA/SilA
MITQVIEYSVRHRLIVLVLALLLGVGGWLAIKETPLDAIPDLSDTQVIVRTDFTGQSPQTVEDLVTYPLSSTMLGLAGVKDVRGYSMFGSSFIYIIFDDGVDQYWARSRVSEALSQSLSELPAAAKPRIGPDATGVGWVYQYALVDESGTHDLSQLRSLQDWYLKYELASVEGVSEVATVGGYEREYQVLIDPLRLQAHDVTPLQVVNAIKGSSSDVGGRVIEQGEMEMMIRSKGYVDSTDDLASVVLRSDNGVPLTLGDVATVQLGPALRRGVAELDGTGEVVGGIVVMRSGENALDVIERVKKRLDALSKGLPEGIEIVTVYDRAPLIVKAIDYLNAKLIEEALVVALITLLFLLHVRSAFVAIITLPLGVMAAFVVMSWQGISANIMSLGGIAIAIGAMVDASIVMVENAHRKLSLQHGEPSLAQRQEILIASMKEVGPGLFFSLVIITVSFLPVFALAGESYRLFSPLAYTKTYAMAAASVLSVTLVPVLMLYLVRGSIRKEEQNPINRFFIALYKPLLEYALRFKKMTLLLAAAALLSTFYPLKELGREFMPSLYEGELLYMPTTLPGVSITQAKAILAQTNRLIRSIPEVEQVFGKAGRADTATDPAPVSMIESWIRLKPKEQWREGITIEALIKELDERVKLPGLVNSWGYPIKIRMDMISTGIRTPIGIKITGNELGTINEVALQVERSLKEFEHVRSVFADRVEGGKYLEILPKRKAMAQYGVRMADFQSTVSTVLGGMVLTEAVEGRERYSVMMRLERHLRESPEDIGHVRVPTIEGTQIPLGLVAEIRFSDGPAMIKSENARLSGWVFVDIEETDIGSFVEKARAHVDTQVQLPAGYALEWSGQFEQMQEAGERLRIAIPMTVFIIVVLLLIHFNRLDRTLMVMLSLPFGLIGGIWALFVMDYHLSVAVAIGFIALGGVAVETAVVMLIYLDLQFREKAVTSARELHEAVMQGAVMRIRPKLMTVSVILTGLLPIFLTEGIGSDVMRRIALPMVGGMLSTTLLTLIVIPVIYAMWEGYRMHRRRES